MQQTQMLPKSAKAFRSIIALIIFSLLLNYTYELSEVYPNIVYAFNAGILCMFGGFLVLSNSLNLHAITIPISTIVTLIFGNSTFYLVTSNVWIVIFSIAVMMLLGLFYSSAKDAASTGLLFAILNIVIWLGIADIIILLVHFIVASMAILFAIRHQFIITRNTSYVILCSSGLVLFIGLVFDGPLIFTALFLLYCGIYLRYLLLLKRSN